MAFPPCVFLSVLNGVSAHVIIVGVNAPVKSAGDSRAPHVIHVGVHLSREPLELGLIDQLDACERGGGSGGGRCHVYLVCDEDASERFEVRGGSKALKTSWICKRERETYATAERIVFTLSYSWPRLTWARSFILFFLSSRFL